MEKLKLFVILSFLFASVLFFGGIFVGYTLQGKQMSETNSDIYSVDNELDQMETMILMNSVNKNLTCTYLNDHIKDVYGQLESIRVQVVAMERDVHLRNTNEYDTLVAHLINMRVKYWLLGEAIRTNCNPNLTTVLFFYTTNTKCVDCDVMGAELSDISKKCNVVIAPIPMDSKDELANLFVKNYNVTSDTAPVIIVNQKTKIVGLVPESNLTEILCNS